MVFVPPRSAIAGISNANPAVVTTTQAHSLASGQVVRLHVPPPYGMFQLNQKQFSITVLSANTFSLQYTQTPFVNVDSTNYPAFVSVAQPQFTAEVISMGSGACPLGTSPGDILNSTATTTLADQTRNITRINIPF